MPEHIMNARLQKYARRPRTSRRRWNVENASDVWLVYTQRDGMREADPIRISFSAAMMAASGHGWNVHGRPIINEDRR